MKIAKRNGERGRNGREEIGKTRKRNEERRRKRGNRLERSMTGRLKELEEGYDKWEEEAQRIEWRTEEDIR